MSQEIIHVYFMPGMAANPTIFEHIKLSEDQFQMHWLEWMIPNKKESLESYAKRMIAKIEHDNIVLLGVSFGGILVQEMSKHMKLRKLFVVSSVKSKHELPKRMKLMKITKAYKILPTQLVSNIDFLAKYAFGETVTKRVELYKKYLSVSDKHYLDWAIENVIEWNQDQPNAAAIYIHGEKDSIFPHSCIGNCLVVKGGTHIMIINKFKWFNENLPKLILNQA
ncbi:alpha/beta hydrolase [Psychroserpens ponticola]|uniref:Alpha/beta hydrolase n=1 Tax=Psychroserpens ponticola TaxID=2932268 RepID=A0ABY7RWL9_9FLAO|nr:alpha/beta hydrolase [Psychroserpens ponticola]WCO00631.1 alpha/beta hydrolase [Psychroserpens ponticola]